MKWICCANNFLRKFYLFFRFKVNLFITGLGVTITKRLISVKMKSSVQKAESTSRIASASVANAQQQNAEQQQSTSGNPPRTEDTSTSPAAVSAKVNKPSDSRLKQQKLKAWQPILTAGTVLPTFFVIGLIFIPIGVVLFITSNNVQEHIFDYTDSCKTVIDNENVTCKDVIKNDTLKRKLNDGPCTCDLTFAIKADVPAPVFIYYGLTNFYQNHRRYVKSRDDVQLLGEWQHTSPDCAPFDKRAIGNDTLVVVPCGAVANSLFNDTFFLSQTLDGSDKAVQLLYTDIAWSSDKDKKFFNPKGGWKDLVGKIANPPNWGNKYIYNMTTDIDDPNNGFKNESLMVWMRTAALPTFRKLHSRVDHSTDPFKNGLPAGNYTVHITYTYPVDSFDGRKRFIISNTSWAGGKNPFLGIAYIVVGSLCILTGFIFLAIHMKFGKSLTELASVN